MTFSAHSLNSYLSESDGIPLYVLCLAWSCVSSFVAALVNLFLSSSTFPTTWKRALIRPLSKVRNPLSPSDTRPIANLSELSKVLEKIVSSQINSYLEEHHILDPRQSAYQSFHST